MKRFLLMTACLVGLASCQREELREPIKVGFDVLDVYTDMSKATYDASAHKLAWEFGDEIGCFAEQNKNIKFTNSVQAPTTFTGTVFSIPPQYFFYHPFNLMATADETVVTTELPANQALNVDDFAVAPVMVATSTDLSNGVTFHNACGLVKFTVETDAQRKLVSAEFSGNNGELIAGAGTVDMASATPSFVVGSNGVSKITMTGEVDMQAGQTYSFILALPPTSFTKGIAITLRDENGYSYTKSFDKAMNLGRNKAINVSTVLEFTDANAVPAVDLQVTAFDLTGISGETVKIDNENNTITVSKTGFTNPQKLATKMAVSATGSSEAVTVTLNPTTTIVAGGTIHPDNTGVISNLNSFTMNLMMPRTVTLACGDKAETYTIKFSQLSNLGLPVVYINTATGKDVPVNAKDTWIEGSEIYIDADGKSTFDGIAFSDLANIECDIKGRGNTTWNEWVADSESKYTNGAKRPYAIKLDSQRPVLGMAQHKRWVLLNNFYDKSMVRNYVAYRIANKIAAAGSDEWHPSGQFVEVVMNGLHRGTYLLCEQIKISSGRVKGTEYDDKIHTTAVTNQISYLLEGDRNWGHTETGDPNETLYWESYRVNTSWKQSSNGTYIYGTNYTNGKYNDGTGNYKFRWGLKSPDDGDLGSSSTGKATGAYQFINGKVTDVEKFFFGEGFTKSTSLDVINQYINLDSFIEYWLVYEIAMNQEPNNPGSCYMHYYEGDGKFYMGPVWDFDFGSFLTSNQFDDGGLYPDKDEHFLLANALWYCRILQNTNVQEYIKQKWPTYKAAAQSVANEMATIKTYLNSAATSNFELWPFISLSDISNSDPNKEKDMTFEAALNRVNENLVARLDQLEELINNKSYN